MVLVIEQGGNAVTARGSARGARLRRCIASGEVLPEARLVRFVADPDGRVVTDVEAKLPGRGLWVRSERAAIERAVAKRLFARAARMPLDADADLAAQAETRLVARMLATLGLARRSGDVILGFDALERALRSGRPPAVIVTASEASAEGARKLQAAALVRGVAPFAVTCLSAADLSLALGRANVVHAALKPGRHAERFIYDAGRLSGFRPLTSGTQAGASEAPRG